MAELEDRLAPDLGLDDNGSLLLDFGPRQFTVSFDETLKPFVRDVSGSRLKTCPNRTKAMMKRGRTMRLTATNC